MSNIRSYMTSLMNDRRKDPLSGFVKALLFVASGVYSAAITIVRKGYSSGARKTYGVSIPVISVGNITLGGTGKTPFTIFLADHLQSEGKHPAIITRGYGGDESRMMKDELPDVPVLVGQDRFASAEIAQAEGSDIAIMDDGFQHRRLRRDMDIVLVDAVSGFGNGHLCPRGVLREPVSELKRADVVVLTKCDMAGSDRLEEVRREVTSAAGDIPIVEAVHKPSFLTDVTGAAYDLSTLEGKKVCLVSGIVDPAYFERSIEKLGGEVVARIDHDDHHAYSQRDIAEIHKICLQKKIDIVATTGKDRVKFAPLNIGDIEEKLFVLNISMEITAGKETFFAGLNSIILG